MKRIILSVSLQLHCLERNSSVIIFIVLSLPEQPWPLCDSVKARRWFGLDLMAITFHLKGKYLQYQYTKIGVLNPGPLPSTSLQGLFNHAMPRPEAGTPLRLWFWVCKPHRCAPAAGLWEKFFPWNWAMVLKRLRTTILKRQQLNIYFRYCTKRNWFSKVLCLIIMIPLDQQQENPSLGTPIQPAIQPVFNEPLAPCWLLEP